MATMRRRKTFWMVTFWLSGSFVQDFPYLDQKIMGQKRF